jgi:hypothetical protein
MIVFLYFTLTLTLSFEGRGERGGTKGSIGGTGIEPDHY